MAQRAELSDFHVGCHFSGLSSRAIATKLNRPKSKVAIVLLMGGSPGELSEELVT